MRALRKLALPVATSLVLALALPAAALAQPQQSQETAEMPETIDGKMVHKIEGTVVEYERPMVAVDVKIKDDQPQPEDAPNITVYMMEQGREYPDRLEPGTPVTVWYTTDDAEKNWAAKIEVEEIEGDGSLR